MTLKTLQEALDQALTEAWVPPAKLNEPNIMISTQVDSEHFEDSKKFGGAFSKAYKVRKIPGLGAVESTLLVTKEDAEEIYDMIERGTIEIKAMQVSKDLDTGDGWGESYKYVKFTSLYSKIATLNQFKYLDQHKIVKHDD